MQQQLSVYQPDGDPPPADVLAEIMREVDAVREANPRPRQGRPQPQDAIAEERDKSQLRPGVTRPVS